MSKPRRDATKLGEVLGAASAHRRFLQRAAGNAEPIGEVTGEHRDDQDREPVDDHRVAERAE